MHPQDWIERAAGKRMDIGGVITSWNPPYSYEWRPHNNLYSMTGGWTLNEKGKSTIVTRYSDSHLSGFFKFFSFIILPMIKRQVQREMQELKRLIEARKGV